MVRGLIVTVLIAVLGVGGYFAWSFYGNTSHWEELAEKRLKTLVREGSNGLYALEMGRVNINPVGLSVSLENIRLRLDSTTYLRFLQLGDTPTTVADLKIEKITINNVSAEALLSRDLKLSSIHVLNPEISISQLTTARSSNISLKADSLKKTKKNLYDGVRGEIGSVSVDTIALEHCSFLYNNTTRKNNRIAVKDLSLDLFHFLLDSNSVTDTRRFLLSEECTVALQKFSMPVNNNYSFEMGSFSLKVIEGTADLKDVRLLPKHSESEFSRRHKTDIKRFDMRIPHAVLKDFNYMLLLQEQALVAEELALDGFFLDVYHNRQLPKDKTNKVGEYPHQVLMRLKYGVNIRRVSISDASVVYRQYNPKSSREGNLHFRHINGRVDNVCNMRHLLKSGPNMVLTANARFMNGIPMQAVMRFNNLSKNGQFSANGTFSAFKGEKLNRVLLPMGMLNIKDADVRKVKVDMTGNDYSGTGRISFMYDNLQLEIMEKDEDEDEPLHRNLMKTIIVNEFFINKQNLQGDEAPDVVKVTVSRDVHRNLFNLVWLTIREGLKQTVITPKGLQKMKQRREKKKG